MPYISLDGWRVWYETEGTGEPMILLHNWWGSGVQAWAPVIPHLARHFQLIIPDLRAHGQTGNPENGPISPRIVAGDALALADALGIEQAHWAGYSFGGHGLLWIALSEPERVRSMATVGTPYALAPKTREMMRRLGLAPDPGWIEETKKRHPAVGPEGWRWFAAESINQAELTYSDVDLGALLAVTAPTLVIGGDDDSFTPVEQTVELYRAIPGARLLVLPKGGHPAHKAYPELVAEQINRNAARAQA